MQRAGQLHARQIVEGRAGNPGGDFGEGLADQHCANDALTSVSYRSRPIDHRVRRLITEKGATLTRVRAGQDADHGRLSAEGVGVADVDRAGPTARALDAEKFLTVDVEHPQLDSGRGNVGRDRSQQPGQGAGVARSKRLGHADRVGRAAQVGHPIGVHL